MSEIDRSIIGRKFGKLTVVEFDHMGAYSNSYWLCRCDCGETRIVSRRALVNGETKRCRNCHQDIKVDLTGKRFGKLTVLGLDHVDRKRGSFWLCQCDCGNEIVMRRDSLTTGNTKSCGCYFFDVHRTHGMTNTRLFREWTQMRRRCRETDGDHYQWYGARGISVCSEWDNFETFCDWTLNNGYRDDLTIDRIDNNLGYYPENCRWVDNLTQQNNRSNNRRITYRVETHSAKEWSRILGVSYSKLLYRLDVGNMSDFEEYFKEIY